MSEGATDGHILRVSNREAKPEDYERMFNGLIAEIQGKMDIKIPKRVIVNYPVQYPTNEGYGFAWIWLESSEAYNVLLGNNPDGSERVEWEAADFIRNPFENTIIDDDTNWGDIDEEEEYVSKKLPPLIKVPDDYKIEAAYTKPTRKGQVSYIHQAHNVPDWVTPEHIKFRVVIFGQKYQKQIFVRNGDSGHMETYPIVNIRNGTATVTWDPSTNDGFFSLLMTRKLSIKEGGREATLIFNYASENVKLHSRGDGNGRGRGRGSNGRGRGRSLSDRGRSSSDRGRSSSDRGRSSSDRGRSSSDRGRGRGGSRGTSERGRSRRSISNDADGWSVIPISERTTECMKTQMGSQTTGRGGQSRRLSARKDMHVRQAMRS